MKNKKKLAESEAVTHAPRASHAPQYDSNDARGHWKSHRLLHRHKEQREHGTGQSVTNWYTLGRQWTVSINCEYLASVTALAQHICFDVFGID